MMARTNYLCFFLLIFFFPLKVNSQTAEEMVNWLRKNITIYYLSNPNTATPQKDFRKISTDLIVKADNGIYFGKDDNNGMERNAQLLTALFKSKSTDPKMTVLQGKDGDLKFQETMYHAMQISGKPITIFFINDVNQKLSY